MKCFYHLDDDGKCAAAIIAKNIDHLTDPYGEEYIRINYDIPFPFEKINKNEYVYIVDFSISPKDMTKLKEITENIIWIDHHYTAIEKNKGIHDDVPGIRYSNDEFQLSGAALTYIWTNMILASPELVKFPFINMSVEVARAWFVNMPPIVQYVSAYDTWQHHLLEGVTEFHAGMDMVENKEDFKSKNNPWITLNVDDVIRDGITALKFRDGWAENYVNNFSYEVEFEGYRCCVLQLQTCGSQWFKSQENKGYDIFIACAYNGYEWITSLYSTTIDVGQIALKYGGGGHKGAAGFHTKEFLFNK